MSSFLLDNYPPGAHLFPPGAVFNQLYKGPLVEAVPSRVLTFTGSTDVILRAGFVRQVRYSLQVCFTTMAGCARGSEKPAADVHRDTLATFQHRWCSVHSSETCLSCLRRRPQVELPCGHAVCENCVAVYGQPYVGDRWLYLDGDKPLFRMSHRWLSVEGAAAEFGMHENSGVLYHAVKTLFVAAVGHLPFYTFDHTEDAQRVAGADRMLRERRRRQQINVTERRLINHLRFGPVAITPVP
ncbi:hypothetical protein SBRCBS47491_008618 [Sporothrix bragantina]|uniref:RING-type domain-containing protein n=1 Tax=Sporothrix bragantina TaxID=671064 RepID=A0ABP0CR29_9PEZI